MSRHAREKNPEIRPSCELPLFEQNFYKFEQQHSALPEIPAVASFVPPVANEGGEHTGLSARRQLRESQGEQNKFAGERSTDAPTRAMTVSSPAIQSCLTAPLSATGESGDCRSLSGTGSPRDVARARRTDRETSHAAARSISLENLGRTRNAILRLLKAFPYGLTDEQLIETYREAQAVSPQNFWNATDSGIRSRRADLVRWGFVCEAGMGETKSKRACTIWKLTPMGEQK